MEGGTGVGAAANQAAPATTRNQDQQRDPIINARDRLFHTLFFRISLAYARGCPRQIRRLIECLFLIKAVVCMCMLVYIHLVYTRQPVQCLHHLADKWPRDGVLRVEIQRGGPTPGYDIYTSYEKERRLALRQRELENLGSFFSIITGDIGYTESLKSSEESEESEEEEEEVVDMLEVVEPVLDIIQPPPHDPEYQGVLASGTVTNTSGVGQEEKISTLTSTLDYMKDRLHSLQEALKEEKEMTNERLDSISEYGQDIGAQASKLKTVIVNMTDELSQDSSGSSMSDNILEDKSDLEKLSRLVWAEDGYIIEYSLEIGFLRLSPATRERLNIPVHIEVLDPNTNSCFGDAFSKFILENMLGYEDVLMSSVKTLAEKENNKGFLRNVVTGAQYHFKAKWTSVTSYIPAVLVMIVFTISISMLLRYSQHQIFVFIIDLLQMVELNTNITFPVAPLLTVILALVGMEAIMSEFFEDTTTAFYIILLVWLCDQYDSICCHTPITKRYWLRFFYLYHTAFYAYHYRFSGQYSGLALLTMWLFTQHSMIYFFHHYELPVILQQAQIRDILNRTNGQVHINFNNVTLNNNNNNNNANVANNNVVRRIIRPRFTLGRFQFRFVFQALHNPPPNATEAAPLNNNTPTNAHSLDSSNSAPATNTQEIPSSSDTDEGSVINRTTSSETTGASQGSVANSVDSVDTAALHRYAAEIVESTREVEQLDREGRLELLSTQNLRDPPFDRQDSREEEDCSSHSDVVEVQHSATAADTSDATTSSITQTSNQPLVTSSVQPDSETCDVPSLVNPNTEGLHQNHSDNDYLSSCSVNANSGDSEAHCGKEEIATIENNSNITNTDTEASSNTAASLQNDLLEIRSDLADAAREASQLLRDINHHN